MKTGIFFLLILFLLCISAGPSVAQTFTVEVQLKNQPANSIVFGSVRGDEFIAIDSTKLNQPTGKITFSFPADAHPGVYRINFGKTPAARILNEPPQQLDFIFDNENIVFETDFKNPLESLKVVKSKENMAWFGFLAKDNLLQKNIKLLEKEIDSYREKGESDKMITAANNYNQLQMERDMFVVQTALENRGLFASLLIKNLRVPILDGYLTPSERNLSYKKEFFKTLDFTDPLLINSTVYTDNIFNYLVSYNQYDFTPKQRETEYIKALDVVIPNIKNNDEVYRFLMAYLVHGFNVLEMDNIINYISKKYNFPK